MKTISKISILIVIIVSSILLGAKASAQIIDVTEIDVSDVQDGKAVVTWTTNTQTRGIVYFGEDQNSMKYYVGHNAYSQFHSADLTGLKDKTRYYFKIVAYDDQGNVNEAYVQYFETTKMTDRTAPVISDLRLIQKTDDAMVISFVTDEKTSYRIDYGQTQEAYTKKIVETGRKFKHYVYIYKLDPNTKYYLKIRAIDAAKNESVRLMEVQTVSRMPKKVLEAEQIKPLSVDDKLVLPEEVTISWRSTLVAKSVIKVREAGKSRSKTYTVSAEPSGQHEIKLKGLKANTTYFYQIEMSGGIYKKKFERKNLSFTTKSLNSDYVRGLYEIGDLVKVKGSKFVYLLRNDNKILFTEKDFKKIGYDAKKVKIVPAEHLEFFETQDSLYQIYQNEELVKLAGDPAVYLVSNGVRRAFFTGTAFERLGYNWADVVIIDIDDLMAMPRGEDIH